MANLSNKIPPSGVAVADSPIFTGGITVTGTVAATDFTGDGSSLTGFATVATSGDYTDLISLPTLGTAAATAITDYATSAQGTSADTAFGWGDHDAAGYLPLTGGTMTGQLTSPNINLTGFLNFTGTGASFIYSNDGGEDIEIRVNNSQSATATDLLLRGRGANDTITNTIQNTIVSQISSTGLVVTGTVAATSYTGDGSALTGISGGGGITWAVKTTTYTAVANDGIIADTSGGIWTLTLPATPSTGDYIQIIDGADWNANNLTVARNGETIESVAADLIVNVGNIAVDFIFDGTTWQVATSFGGDGGDVATLSSPDFTGVPTAPTATAGTNTTQLATTAFVQAAAGGSTAIAQVRNTSAISNLNGSTSFTDVAITGISDFMDTGFTAGSTGIICGFTGRIAVTVHILQSASSARTNVKVRAAVGGVGSPIEGATGYIRATSDHNESSSTATSFMSVTSGDEVTLQTQQEGNTGTVTGPAGGCMISITKL